MWQQFIERIKQLLAVVFGRQKQFIPQTPAETEIKTAPSNSETPPVIKESELELGTDEPARYKRRDFFFSYRERTFFRALVEDIGSQYLVFAKVRMGDVLCLANEPKDRKRHNNQVFCKHFDFVLCDRMTFMPVLIIELDDSSHTKFDNHERDEFKNRACAEAGLKLWRLNIERTYPKGSISNRIQTLIQEK